MEVAALQVEKHPSPSTKLESSHSSPTSTFPLEHSVHADPKVGQIQFSSSMQVAEHPSPEILFESSHVSPVSRIPFPQRHTISGYLIVCSPQWNLVSPFDAAVHSNCV